MSPFLEALSRVPDLLAAHLLLAASALALGLGDQPAARHLVGAVAPPSPASRSVSPASIQTIPSLALLALFYPLLLSLSTLVGGGIPRARLPALAARADALRAAADPRNGVTGLAGIDPAVIEAADGVGMTAWQKLRLVEAPLVAPVLMAGIRTAAVWTIGAATLSTTVGQPSLGDMIFAGLQTQNWALVLAGCLTGGGARAGGRCAARRDRARHRRCAGSLRVWIAAAMLALGVLAALALLLPKGGETVVIGAKGFSEQYILARVIGHRLEKAATGSAIATASARSSPSRRSRAATIDIYVDYSGTVWTNGMKRTDVLAPRRDREGRGGLGAAQPRRPAARYARFREQLCLCHARRRCRAARDRNQHRRSRADRAAAPARHRYRIPGTPRMGGGEARAMACPSWRPTPISRPSCYRALTSGTADVIPAFSSDGRIAADKLTVLTDPKGAIPGYDAILPLAPKRARDERLRGRRDAADRPGARRGDARGELQMVDRDADKASPRGGGAVAGKEARLVTLGA